MFVNRTPGLTQIAWTWIIVTDWVSIGPDAQYWGRFDHYWGQTDPLIIETDSMCIGANFRNTDIETF